MKTHHNPDVEHCGCIELAEALQAQREEDTET